MTSSEIKRKQEWVDMQLRLRARLKIKGDGEGQIWMRLDGDRKEILSFKNMGGAPATEGDWQTYEIEILGKEGGKSLYVGAFLVGSGSLLADDFELDVKRNGSWQPIPLGNGSFEASTEMAPWTHKGDEYEFSVTTVGVDQKLLKISKK